MCCDELCCCDLALIAHAKWMVMDDDIGNTPLRELHEEELH